MSDLEIKYIKRGIANRIGNTILLHESLQKEQYKALKAHSIEHELKHSSGTYDRKDFAHDMIDILQPKIVSKQFFKFYFTERGAWQQSLPAFWYEGRLYWDLSKLWQLGIMTGLVLIGVWLLI